MPTLNVRVTRVAYPPATDEGDWYIIITDKGACKGKMSWRPKPNDSLALTGEWTSYRGEREFSFKSATLDIPSSPRDQLHYVCERTVGLGPALEDAIWNIAGDDWQNISPGQVPRMSDRVYEEFRLQVSALAQDQEHVKVVSWLVGKGATMNMAEAAWEKWENESIGVVSDDCYRLAELPGYGFQDVDRVIRGNFGITDSDPRRISACVIYCLRQLTKSGSTVVAWQDLMSKTCGMLGGYDGLVTDAVKELFNNDVLKGFPESQHISLGSDYWNEQEILKYVDEKD